MYITDRAIKKILDCQKDFICLYTEKGGCADYKYCFTFDSNRIAEPFIYSFNKIKVMVESKDVSLMHGLQIDHVASIVSEKFIVKINNPELEKCSCGISFKLN